MKKGVTFLAPPYPCACTYTHSSDFLSSCIFSMVVLPTFRYLISSSSGMVRNRLTSIIVCPFSCRIMFANFSALFAIVKTLSSFILILFGCPLAASGIASTSYPVAGLLPGHHVLVGTQILYRFSPKSIESISIHAA